MRSRAHSQEEFSTHLWCKRGDLIKAWGQDQGAAKLLHWGCEEWLVIYLGVGGCKEKERGPKGLSYAKEDPRDTGGLAIVQLRLFFLLVRC